MKNNDVIRAADFIGSREIDSIDSIAGSTYAQDKEGYIKNFAENIAKAKLDKSQLSYSLNGDLRFVEYNGQKFLIMVSPVEILPKNGKEYVKRHANKIARVLEENKLSGVIYFMPFLMNNGTVRDVLKREVPVGFINMPYDNKSLERRIATYKKNFYN